MMQLNSEAFGLSTNIGLIPLIEIRERAKCLKWIDIDFQEMFVEAASNSSNVRE